jgi:hypothetical protein
MNPKILPRKQKPEAEIQEAFEKFLVLRKWSVRSTHGSLYQHGFPDIFACHIKFGARWIEIKNPLHYRFTAAQLEYFPELNSHGVGVWVIVRATEDEYLKLFRPQNWFTYLN